MGDDGWACCYVLFRDRGAADVASLLGGTLSAPTRTEREATKLSAPWPTVGPASEAWTVVIDPHLELGDADAELRQWSVGTQVVRLLVIESEAFSHASVWANGEIVWDVSFEGELDDRPLVDERFPYDVDEIASTIDAVPGPQAWYQVPVVGVQRLTDWHPRPSKGGPDQSFADLVYPRPPGVAAWVAQELADELTIRHDAASSGP
jgi:hypothetical protein